ncbi:thioesterase-like superfamily-domain-containing protein [Lyophyllum atratum]|nr:thioesterase-like superfamily-domain-containing protein [Lyophyllum atratum]
MAPFYEAGNIQETVSDGNRDYVGEMDPKWSIGAVPNGGYVLALLVDACIRHQSSSNHPDPIHVTAHYVRAAAISQFEIRIRTVKTGRSFSNLIADLHQRGVLIITTHQIFGINIPSPNYTNRTPGLTLAPPSSYARRIPLYTHPSTAIVGPVRDVWNFHSHINVATDPHILAKNALDHPNRTSASTVGGDGLEWGAWLTFEDKRDQITNPALAFLVDIFTNMVGLLPPSERQGLGKSWLPTMVLAMEFKAPIPSSSATHASRTVGLYSSGKFMNDGRHDAYVEVWTAPCDIGEGKELPGWREKQVCLAIATQMAYVMPFGVNLGKGKKKEAKL